MLVSVQPVHSGLASWSCAEKDVRKLQAENRKLKQEMMRLEDKHGEAAKKVTSLQAKIKQLEKYVPKTSMKELRREGYQTTTQVSARARLFRESATILLLTCLCVVCLL